MAKGFVSQYQLLYLLTSFDSEFLLCNNNPLYFYRTFHPMVGPQAFVQTELHEPSMRQKQHFVEMQPSLVQNMIDYYLTVKDKK